MYFPDDHRDRTPRQCISRVSMCRDDDRTGMGRGKNTILHIIFISLLERLFYIPMALTRPATNDFGCARREKSISENLNHCMRIIKSVLNGLRL